MEPNYTMIDIKKWSRGKLFKSYIDNLRIVMSLTVDIDVTELIEFSKSNNFKFYPSMIWIVSKIVNAHDEFKYSWDSNGNQIKWEYVFPSYTLWNNVSCSPPRQGHALRCALWVYIVKQRYLRILAILHQSQLNKGRPV